jgi:hypothetical protein
LEANQLAVQNVELIIAMRTIGGVNFFFANDRIELIT